MRADALTRWENSRRLDWLERHIDDERYSAAASCRVRELPPPKHPANFLCRHVLDLKLPERLKAILELPRAGHELVIFGYDRPGAERRYLASDGHWRRRDEALAMTLDQAEALVADFDTELFGDTVLERPAVPFDPSLSVCPGVATDVHTIS
jgi:hypothetical protein